MGKRNVYKLLVGKPKGQRPVERRSWVGNVKTDLGDVGWSVMDWIDLAQDRDKCRALLNAAMRLRAL
jgi:hypothetical protein